MATKPTKITEPNWPALSGRILEGGYEIQELLEADGPRAAFKIRVLGAHTVNAYVDFFQVLTDAAQEQLDLWRNAKELSHRNLSTPLSSGSTELDGIDLIYVILHRPDERLSGVLRERALNPQEAGELLKSAIAALEHLHANGFVHGCLSPEQVLATGDSIQLSTVCIRRINTVPTLQLTRPQYVAPEASVNITPAADVWCLGATLFETLTKNSCIGDCVEQAGKLTAPFATIVRRCLEVDPQTRCKLSDVLPLYKGSSPVRAPAKPAAQPPKLPVLAEVPRVSKPHPARTQASSQPRRTWIYAAVGLIFVLAAIWFARPKRVTTRSAPVPVAAAPANGSRPKAWETRTLTPPDAATRRPASSRPAAPTSTATPNTPAAHSTPVPSKQEPRTANRPVWRVIVYTYARQQDAENKAKDVNAKHPGLNAETFSPTGGSPFVVTVGGRMTREDAARVRQQIRGMGLPRDSYIQNYKQ